MLAGGDAPRARQALLAALQGAPRTRWLDTVRQLQQRGELAVAGAVADAALADFVDDPELLLVAARADCAQGANDRGERRLRALLARQPEHLQAVLLLAQQLAAAGRTGAMATVLGHAFAGSRHRPEALINAVEMLEGVGRQIEALALCEAEIGRHPADARLHLLAASLALQTGDFGLSRHRYDYALAQMPDAVDWHAPLGLASTRRYRDRDDADFARFRALLARPGLNPAARASLQYALGKMHDDVGDIDQAAACWRQANAITRSRRQWTRKRWRRAIEARLTAPRPRARSGVDRSWTPVFIVGMPRSGTTLLATRLDRHPQVRHRGELGWLAALVRRETARGRLDAAALERIAHDYVPHLLQDDAPARWYIDKQPLNLRYIDIILALWPHARILWCRRSDRDVALSLWAQSFADDEHGYACDFTDMAVVMRDGERLMARWQHDYGDAIREVHYESLVADDDAVLAPLRDWLGLPPATDLAADTDTDTETDEVLATASLWQARQPVNTRSVARWRRYAAAIPELLRFAAANPDQDAASSP